MVRKEVMVCRVDLHPCRGVAPRNPILSRDKLTRSSIPKKHDNNTIVHMKTIALLKLHATVLS